MAKAVKPGNGLARGLVAIVLGLGSAALVIAVGEGNQEILAWPVAMWLAMVFWPVRPAQPGGGKSSAGKGKAHRSAGAGYRKMAPPLAILVWTAVFVTAWPALTADGGQSRERILARLAKAEQLAGDGEIERALAAFEAIDVPAQYPLDKARKYHNCGVLLIRLGRADEAAEHLSLALQYDGGNAQAAYLLAVLSAEAGEFAEAHTMLDKALEIDPGYAPALRLRQDLAAMPAGPSERER